MREILLVDPGRSVGGTESVVLDSARRLAAHGDRVTVLVSADPGVDALARDLAAAGAVVDRAADLDGPATRIAALVRKIEALAPDLLHVHLPWPHACPWVAVAGRLAGIPAIVATEHLLFPENHVRDDLRKRALAPCIDRTIAVSAGIGETLVSRWRIPAARVVVVPNGVDVERFSGPNAQARARGRRALGLDEEALLVGSVGRLEGQKGFAQLVRAAARLRTRFPALRVAIAGDGSLAGALREEAREAGVGERVLLPGRVAEMKDFLAALDLFALPSLWEGMPLSLLEAMAMGVPAIATATPGALEILGGPERVGVAVALRDEAALADAIGSLLADPEERRGLGIAGRARVRERHDAARQFGRVLAVYDTLTEGARP